jgi:hypothetical protein
LGLLILLLAWALAEAGPPQAGMTAPAAATSFASLGSIGVPDELLPFVEHEINAGLFSALGQSVGTAGIAGVGSNLGSTIPQLVLPPLPGLTAGPADPPPSSDGTGAQGQSVSFPSDLGVASPAQEADDPDAGMPGDEDEGDDGEDADSEPAAGGAESAGGAGDDGGEGEEGEDGDEEDEDEDDDDDDDDD